MTYMATQAQESLTRGHEIYKFRRTTLGHHYYILSLSDLYIVVEKKIIKNIMQLSLYDLHDHALAQEHLN